MSGPGCEDCGAGHVVDCQCGEFDPRTHRHAFIEIGDHTFWLVTSEREVYTTINGVEFNDEAVRELERFLSVRRALSAGSAPGNDARNPNDETSPTGL